MENDRWNRISSLFATALEQDPGKRRSILEAADLDLRREVESLLIAHEETGALDRLALQMDGLRREALATATGDSGGDLVRDAHGGSFRLEPGRRLGRYDIRARLGAGGMGEVYRAFDTRLQREVAIKILRRRAEERPGALARFEREARAASALNHPNIVTLYDIGEEAAFPYIVMELVHGESLRRMLASPWPVELLLYLAVQIAEALTAAHERQIVHRDLKPENILVNRQGVAKLLDFGLARFWMDEEKTGGSGAAELSSRPDVLLGTPGYLSPELATGHSADARSDQFSLGAILYEMATGNRAFNGETALEILESTLHQDPLPLSRARPDLALPLAEAVQRCLRKSPGERYPTTRALLEDLRAARRSRQESVRTATRSVPVVLPKQRTRLIGRERELDQIERLILEKQVRLITLTGPPGTGKTRLAVQAAEELAPKMTGGVFFVPLAPITDDTLVATTIAQAIGAVEAVDRSELAGVIGELRRANAPTLLILDNFEQVIGATHVVSELLAACPDLAILVTSRQVLNLYGEHGFPVSTLDRPDPARLPALEKLDGFPAVALFVERARAANPAFRLGEDNAPAVVELCARLDGLPLALELAAAQTRWLPPEAMLSRLGHRLGLLTGGPSDLPDRQQTLRGTLDWSHQLLDPIEEAVFRRLSVFAGGFTLEAAQAVADPYGKLGLPLENRVGGLLDKSLLQLSEPRDGEARFRMLETLREYALEKLAESNEEPATRSAHAAYFLVLAEEGGVALASSEQRPWLRRFETEHDNFRSALEWLTRERKSEWGLRLALGLFHFWERGEHLAEGRRRLEALLEMEETTRFPALRVQAMFAAGVLAGTQGDLAIGIALHTQCLGIYRERGDRWGVVVALVALGNQHVARGNYDTARNFLEQSLDIWQQLGDQKGYARSLSNLAFVARAQRRFDEARALYQRAAAVFERLDDRLSRAWAVNHEGDVAREQDDPAAAAGLYERALATFRSMKDDWGIASSLADLGVIARQRADLAAAGRLYRESLEAFVRLDHRRGIARQLEALACLAAQDGQAERGVRLAAASAVLRQRLGTPPSPALRGEIDASLASIEHRLGGEETRRLWQAGAAMTLEEAIRLAGGDGSETQ